MFESPSLPLYSSLQLFPLMSSHKDHPTRQIVQHWESESNNQGDI